MKSLLLTGLIFFFSANLIHGQTISSDNGLEVENHESVTIILEQLNQDALNIGLSRDRIMSRARIRLRQLGLEQGKFTTHGYLYIRATVVGSSFALELNYNREVNFEVEDNLYRRTATVYNKGVVGTHNRNPEFIISSLDGLFDQFLSDYLDAND